MVLEFLPGKSLAEASNQQKQQLRDIDMAAWVGGLFVEGNVSQAMVRGFDLCQLFHTISTELGWHTLNLLVVVKEVASVWRIKHIQIKVDSCQMMEEFVKSLGVIPLTVR